MAHSQYIEDELCKIMHGKSTECSYAQARLELELDPAFDQVMLGYFLGLACVTLSHARTDSRTQAVQEQDG